MERKDRKTTEIVKVAYADDHMSVRKGIISYLHELGGIEVIIEAVDGQDLMDKLEQSSRQPDVCIIDINMPKMNGFETVAAIKKKWKNKKMLILSTYDEDIYIVRMIRAGANGYLPKACDPDEIKKAILSIHKEGYYYSGLYLEKSLEMLQSNKPFNLSNFTEKELTFLKYACSNLTYAQIAQHMHCTAKSVEGYRDSLFKKLQVNNRVSLALFAVKTGIVLV
ncbi:MAG TPA: response regulator transcription factor [Edaphocola sp.]|nr:response regulator transcription factor [Edaphocola sp.]